MLLKDTITGLDASWNSGIATLRLQEAGGILCDNGQLIRALDAAFDIIRDGHCVDVSNMIGQEIYYKLDDLGLGMLEYFVPVDEVSEEDLEEIERDLES